jgi:hypothetical protein
MSWAMHRMSTGPLASDSVSVLRNKLTEIVDFILLYTETFFFVFCLLVPSYRK